MTIASLKGIKYSPVFNRLEVFFVINEGKEEWSVTFLCLLYHLPDRKYMINYTVATSKSCLLSRLVFINPFGYTRCYHSGLNFTKKGDWAVVFKFRI